MKIQARIDRMVNKGNVKAIASVSLDRMFVVKNLKVMDGKKGMFVSMPQESYPDREGNTKYSNTFFALTNSARMLLQETVLDAYKLSLDPNYVSKQTGLEYLEERDAERGVFSYDALDNGKTVGEESFPDTSVDSIEDLVLAKELADQLHRSIAMLPKGERDLIKAIYFEDITDTEYSKQIAMTQQAVSYQHKRILSKLRFFMNLLTCFCGFFVAGI